MNEYIKTCVERVREVNALQYTKDIPLEVIKKFLQDKFIKCEYGELVVLSENNEQKALLYGDFIVKDTVLGDIKTYSEEIFNELYSINTDK